MKPHYTLIRDARVVRWKSRRMEDLDILILNGSDREPSRIAALGRVIDRADLPDCTLSVVRANGNLVIPSFTDLAVCLREPGSMYKEDIASTCKAALAGGYRRLLTFYEPDARYTAQDALSYLAAARKTASVAIYPTAPMEASDWDSLLTLGAVAMTDRFSPPRDESALRNAMLRSAEKGITLHVFPKIASLTEGGAVNSHIAAMLGERGLSPASEEIAVMRAILLAQETACPIHLSGVSTRRSLAFVRDAKKEGVPVTCDVSPCHFYFDESAILYHGNTAKLMPPLRTEDDRMAVIEAIADGTVDAIASHHTPNDSRDVAAKLSDAPFGAVGLETVFSACVDGLLAQGYIDIFRLVELLAVAPYAILSRTGAPIPKELPELAVGGLADFNLVSLDRNLTVETAGLRGKAKNSPFLGMVLRGRVEKSFCALSE